jgi:hypothetical protein
VHWGDGARVLVVGCLLLRKEQLRRRDFRPKTPILARCGDGERGSRCRCPGWVLHLYYVESVDQCLHVKKDPCSKSRYDVPSGSEPATELFPLQLYPLEFEIADTKDDIDSRLESVAAETTSGRGSRNESGSSRGFTGALAIFPRIPSSVGVASESSTADPDQAWPKYSKRLLSDAFEGRREGRLCRMAFAPSGGTDTLARSTLSPPVSGSLDLAFLPAADAPLAVVRCCHD